MPVYLAIVIVMSAVLQGSSGSIVLCVAGMLSSVPVLAKRGRVGGSLVPAALVLVAAVWYVAASLVNGFSAESLAAAAMPLAIFIISLAIMCLNSVERRSLLTSIVFLSALYALVGIIVFIFWKDSSWVQGAHLVYGFGEPNVAAVWFAAVTLACFCVIEHNRFLVLALPFTMAGCLLTCSVAGVGLLLVGLFVIFIARRNDETCMNLMLYAFVGIVFAVAIYFCRDITIADALLLVAFLALVWFFDVPAEWLVTKKAHYVAAAMVVVAVIVGCVFSMRLQVSFPYALAAMLIIAQEACAAIAANPLFGIGAGQWEYLSFNYQTTLMTSSVVPCSYLSFAVAGGIGMGLLVLLLVVIAVIKASRQGVCSGVCALFIAVMALLYPCLLQVAAVALLAALALTKGPAALHEAEALTRAAGNEHTGEEAPDSQRPQPEDSLYGFGLGASGVLAICIAALAAVFMLPVAFFQGQTTYYCANASASEAEDAACVDAFESMPYWVQNSPAARSIYEEKVLSLAQSGEYEDGVPAAQYCQELLNTTTQENEYDICTRAYLDIYDYDCDAAVEYLLSKMNEQTKSVKLFSVLQNALSAGYVSEEHGNDAVALGEQCGFELEFTAYTDDQISEYEQNRAINESIKNYVLNGSTGDAANSESEDGTSATSNEGEE